MFVKNQSIEQSIDFEQTLKDITPLKYLCSEENKSLKSAVYEQKQQESKVSLDGLPIETKIALMSKSRASSEISYNRPLIDEDRY